DLAQQEAVPDLETLAQLLFFSAGVTRSKKHEQGETFFRAAACTGALYEIELYIVCTDLKSSTSPALPAGIYHFGTAEFGLRQLRSGDFRQSLVEATAGDPAVAHAPVIIVCSGTYWRNAWKYRSRTYRHFGWDNGTILANMLAVAHALKLPARVIAGFLDSPVNALLGLDTNREAAFSLVPIGYHPLRLPRRHRFRCWTCRWWLTPRRKLIIPRCAGCMRPLPWIPQKKSERGVERPPFLPCPS